MDGLGTERAAVTLPRSGDWFAVAAGAVIATGISLTLTTFGAAVGLSVISADPTWRDSTSWLWLVSGLYLVFVALWAFGLGGYVAGRLRLPLGMDPNEAAFRDGLYGLTTWGLALVFGAALVGAAALAARAPAPSNVTTSSTAAETLLQSELDQLFQDVRRPRDVNFAYHRAEAGRILLQLSSKHDISLADRSYLAALVATNTDIDAADAGDRVNVAVADSRDAIHHARVAAVLQAFMIAAGLLLGAAIAWFGAVEGGKERDEGRIPEFSLSRRRIA